jgi:DNA polymerase-1
MAGVLNSGKDLHLAMGATLLGISYSKAAKRLAAGDSEVKDSRQLAKCINFGLPGGLGPAAFVAFAYSSYGVTVSLTRAKQLKAQYLKKWPEMPRYFELINGLLTAKGNKRKQIAQEVSGRIRGRMLYTAACNTLFQGMTADGATRAWWVASQECYTGTSKSWRAHCKREGIAKGTKSPLYGSRPVLFVHDEIVLETPKAKTAAAATRLSQVMIEAMNRYIPHIENEVEPYIAKYWYKAAKPVWASNGDLVEWTPTQATQEAA